MPIIKKRRISFRIMSILLGEQVLSWHRVGLIQHNFLEKHVYPSQAYKGG